MSAAACAKALLCQNDSQSVDKASVDAVINGWFSFPAIADQLEGMYATPRKTEVGNSKAPMNDFFGAYESGDMDKAWEILKQIQVEIK